jgi:hypothetical protein
MATNLYSLITPTLLSNIPHTTSIKPILDMAFDPKRIKDLQVYNLKIALQELINKLDKINPKDFHHSKALQDQYVECLKQWSQLSVIIGRNSHLLGEIRKSELRSLADRITQNIKAIDNYQPSLPERAWGLAGRLLRKLRP